MKSFSSYTNKYRASFKLFKSLQKGQKNSDSPGWFLNALKSSPCGRKVNTYLTLRRLKPKKYILKDRIFVVICDLS